MSNKKSGEAISDKDRYGSHALDLGKLTGMLQSIEMAARMAIARHDPSAADYVQAQLSSIKIGDLVELNAFTNRDDLCQTLKKYNKRAPLDCRIVDGPIVSLRDSLAHGRIFGFGSRKDLRLLKFSKAKDGKVAVELALDMTDEWFQRNIRILNDAFDKITQALDYEKREFT